MLVPLEKPNRNIDFAEGIDIASFKRDMQNAIKRMHDGNLAIMEVYSKYLPKVLNTSVQRPFTNLFGEANAATNKAESVAKYVAGNLEEYFKRM